MKLIIINLFLLVSCNSKTSQNEVQYLTNGYLCEDMHSGRTGTEAYNCENVLTGQKQDIIYNATNIVEVK